MTRTSAPEKTTGSTTRFLLHRGTEALLGVALVVVAVLLALVDAPAGLRLAVTLPVVIGVAGRAVSLLVLHRPVDTVDPERRALVDDATLRAAAPVLFGVIALLASILVTAVLGFTVTTRTVAIGAGVLAALLHVAASFGRRDATHRRSSATRARRALLRVVIPAVAALAVLTLAVAGARAVEAMRIERYTQLSLVDPTVYSTGQLRSAPGARVSLGWVLRGYHTTLPAQPAVSLTIGGKAATGARSTLLAPSADPTDAEDSRRGEVSGIVPTTPGLYRAVLTVGSGDAARTLSLVLEVTA